MSRWIYFISLLFTLILLLHRVESACRIDGPVCTCREKTATASSASLDGSLSNILAYCCQAEIFHVHIHGSQMSGGSAFYQKPCHNLIDFRIHAPSQTVLPPNGQAFNGLPNLEVLHITGDSSLVNLPKGVFSGLAASLRQVNLSGNGLSFLTGLEFVDFADTESSLDVLDLSGNRLQNLRSGCFKHLKSLRKLNLAKNAISEIRADMFSGLEALEELDLRGNPISVIIGGAFKALGKLRRLYISGSSTRSAPLGVLTPGMLYGLQALRNLQISNLGISGVNAETFMELKQLQELDLSGNHLIEVPHIAFKRMVLSQRVGRFQHLNLSNNRITCLSDNGFAEFPQLKSLDLSANLLTVISDKAFRGVKQIRDLSLLDNPLKVIIPSAFDELSPLNEDGVREALSIIYRHRVPGDSTSSKTIVRIPNDENIAGIKKLRLRALYGRQNDLTETKIVPFIDPSCPSLPLPINRVSLKHTGVETDQEIVSSGGQIAGFLSQNKISVIVIVVCAVLTLIVTSATILSCQTCRRRRRKRRREKAAVPTESSITSPPLSEAGKSHYSGLSKQSPYPYNSLEVENSSYCEQNSSGAEKLSTSERLFNLGQHLAPPPYPHNLQTVEERLRQVAASNTPVGLFGAYPTNRDSPHQHLQSGQSSPSNLGSSPRFSSSTSSVQQQKPKALHLIMSTSAIDHDKAHPPPPGSVSPLHESGIASDNASSSLVTALGVF